MRAICILLTTSVVLGCGDEQATDALMTLASPEEIAQIRNGSNDRVRRGVVGLAMLTGGGSGACTGSLIAENVVLTARHCIARLNNADRGVRCSSTTAGAAYSPNQVYVTLEPALTQSPRDYVGVEEIVTPTDPLLCNTDIALLKLDRRIRPEEMPLLVPRVDRGVRTNEVFTIIGYGGTDDQGSGSGQRRIRYDISVTCSEGQCPRYAALDREWGGGGGVCRGDSGGPAIDQQGRVIGVASRGGQMCSSSIYSSVAGWGDWITEHTIRFTREEDYEVPLWADGWPTEPEYNAPVGGYCEEDNECGYGRCIDGYCTRRCDDDDHCPLTYDCHNNWCMKIPQPIGAACDTDIECASEACADQTCVQYCEAHSECPEGYGCDDSGRCAEGLSRLGGEEGTRPPVAVPSPFGCASGAAELLLLPTLLGLRRRRRLRRA